MQKIAGIKHIFFDLDRTLWDFEFNSENVILEMFIAYRLEEKCHTSAAKFIEAYKHINKKLWHLYGVKKISKEELRKRRFTKTLAGFGVHDRGLGASLEYDYVSKSPYQTKLLEGAHEILDYLKPLYALHILTNGFKEAQHIKLKESGIRDHFNNIFISEEIGFQKPDMEIFHAVQSKAAAQPAECLMIGDDLAADIKGALKAGWKAVYFSKNKKNIRTPGYLHINKLEELKDLL